MYFVFVVIVIVVKCHGAMLAGVHACAQVFTMPEYLRMRFGGQRIRIYLAILALLLSVFTKIAVSLSLSLSLSLSTRCHVVFRNHTSQFNTRRT